MIEDGNRVVRCADVEAVETFFEALKMADTDNAVEFDAVHTLEFFVLDSKLTF
jgi:hypothetical protein